VSQYQEYKIGRGLTTNHYIIVSFSLPFNSNREISR
jgi:hypothetical protein